MPLLEIERKRALPDDGQALTDHLAAAGYRPRESYTETDTYYSRPDVDYLVTVECLRVRQRDGFAEITYKPASTDETRRGGVTAKPETNLALADPSQAATAHELLTNIGMLVVARVEKARVQFRHPHHDEVTIAVDTLTGVGVFVETEVMADDSEEATALLDQIERTLGLVGHPVVTLPYRDLVLNHQSLP